jgi:hypothetical protein
MPRRRPDFTFKLDGAGRLEDLPLNQVADLLTNLAGLVARGAAEELNRPLKGTGRWEGSVEQAASVRLVSLRSGSVVADVVRPPDTRPAGLLTAPTLTDLALDRVLDVASGHAQEHPAMAAAMADLLERFRDTPQAKLVVTDRRAESPRRAEIKVADRSALRSAAGASTIRDMGRDVVGRIFEADLEAHSATVRTVTGERIPVTFDPGMAASIRAAFGGSAALRVDVTFDPVTRRAKTFRVREFTAGEQMPLGGVDFWADTIVDELRHGRGTPGVTDAASVRLDLSPEDRAALLELVGSSD